MNTYEVLGSFTTKRSSFYCLQRLLCSSSNRRVASPQSEPPPRTASLEPPSRYGHLCSRTLSTRMIIKPCENPRLDEITCFLNEKEVGIYSLSARIELVEFLHTKEDKKSVIPNFNEFQKSTATKFKKSRRGRSFSETLILQQQSQQRKSRAMSLDDLHQSKDFIIKRLIQIMNEIFPDYDFALSKPTQYIVHSSQTCIRTINNHLAECTLGNPQFLEQMWNSINDAIDINNCEIFAYIPSGN